MAKRSIHLLCEKSILKDNKDKEVLEKETRTLMNIPFIVDYVKAVIYVRSLIVIFVSVFSNHYLSNNSFKDFKDVDKMIELFQEKIKEALHRKKK